MRAALAVDALELRAARQAAALRRRRPGAAARGSAHAVRP